MSIGEIVQKLTGTQIAVMTSLVVDGASASEKYDDAQEVALCHHSSTQKLITMAFVVQGKSGLYKATRLGELTLKRILVVKELKTLDREIAEETKQRKPAMRAILRFVGKK